MTLLDIHNILEYEISDRLSGQLHFNGEVLKWEYDGIQYLHDGLEEQLDIIAHEDKQTIEEFLGDYDDYVVSEPETHDTFAYFYIEK